MRKIIFHLLLVFFFPDLFIDFHLGSLHSSVINHPRYVNYLGFFPRYVLYSRWLLLD